MVPALHDGRAAWPVCGAHMDYSMAIIRYSTRTVRFRAQLLLSKRLAWYSTVHLFLGLRAVRQAARDADRWENATGYSRASSTSRSRCCFFFFFLCRVYVGAEMTPLGHVLCRRKIMGVLWILGKERDPGIWERICMEARGRQWYCAR